MAEPVSIGALVATGLIVGVGFSSTAIAVNETYNRVIKPIGVKIENEIERDYNYIVGNGYKTGEELDKELMKVKTEQKFSELQKLMNKYNSPAEENTHQRLINNFKK